jgi:demethylmenaquinone methyltransferase/2-methoxy-6-polyprenyl-1,4-benzoquinol methylase
MSVLPPIEQKSQYVEQMFSRIAPGYDRMNRIMTGGLDRGWRSYTIAKAAPPANGVVLDVGSGTGDFLLELAEWVPDGQVVGIDLTVSMMKAGLPKIAPLGNKAGFVAGDAMILPFADNTFDAITTGFTMRNVVDIDTTFREMWRVAKPGCVFACLEVARPTFMPFRIGHKIYFEYVVPRLAKLLGADPVAYAYLPQSAQHFPQPDVLARMLSEAGWHDVQYQLLGLGAVAVHTAIKKA